MRYDNWDVLLFPSSGSVPLKEFKTDCSVIPDFESKPASSPGPFGLPVVHGFVPGLPRNMPLTVSIFSWTVPSISNPNPNANLVVFAARVYIDGELVAEDVFNQSRRTPLPISQSLKPNKHGDRDLIRFPAFNEKYLQEYSWNPAVSLGRIQVIVTEAIQRDPTTLSLDHIKNVAAFSFCHAPLETLEEAAIAWPNRRMWEVAAPAHGFPSAVYSTGHDLASQQWLRRLVRDPPQLPLSSTPAPTILPVFQTAANPSDQLHSTEDSVQRAKEESQGRAIRRNPSRTGVLPASVSAAYPYLMHQDTTGLPAHNPGPLHPMYWDSPGGKHLHGDLDPSSFSTESQQNGGAAPLISLDASDSTTDNFVSSVNDAKLQDAAAAKWSIPELGLAVSRGNGPQPRRELYVPNPAKEVKSRKECQPQCNLLKPLASTVPKSTSDPELLKRVKARARALLNTPEARFMLIDSANTAKRTPSLDTLGMPSKKRSAAAKSIRRSASFDPVVKNIEFKRSQPATKPSQCKRDFTPLDVAEAVAQSDHGHSSPIL
ncbi:NADH dehydrogenase (ubiquinone)-like protein [Colletotrichum scovillei]|uniref:NADH dehydrogenase (Ubiquinone)-like protein n=1 Tax=Colletotrichum scovillei TaxID=1209932 RepID=A0A9P7RJY2_9PEZI|nr:NADH dehydrogenase (ubiquinone)-like protein [Colletotrichum scovillei]KAG7078136.1 NADH dehydrogenase (ubiquinone)-like protein [Colletotrichum scovillei]KAG7085246.1 NADH dehydrogenase (ubiquinone)-like protein [Colletotrichum scovillei]